MTDLTSTAQELQRRKTEGAAITYSKSFSRSTAPALLDPSPDYDLESCDWKMLEAIILGLGRIAASSLNRRMESPKADPRDL